jgi:hypothetical protein
MSMSIKARRGSRLFIFAKFLETRIAPQPIEHRTKPKQSAVPRDRAHPIRRLGNTTGVGFVEIHPIK